MLVWVTNTQEENYCAVKLLFILCSRKKELHVFNSPYDSSSSRAHANTVSEWSPNNISIHMFAATSSSAHMKRLALMKEVIMAVANSSSQAARSNERRRSEIKRDQISGSLIHSCSCIETKANRRIIH